MDNPPLPPPFPTPPRNWWQRNWPWFVPTGCLGLLLAFVLFAGAIFMLVMSVMKSSDAYKTAVQRAETNPRVAEALGSPLRGGMFVTGNVNASGSSGKADLAIPLTGPRGKGTLYTVATKSEGTWTYTTLRMKLDGTDRTIDLLDPAPGQ